jgi:hypothetical protein
VFEATRFQQFRAVDNEEFENVMDFMQTMTEAAELILRQLKERDREVRAAEARADQLQQQLLEAQRQLAALQR